MSTALDLDLDLHLHLLPTPTRDAQQRLRRCGSPGFRLAMNFQIRLRGKVDQPDICLPVYLRSGAALQKIAVGARVQEIEQMCGMYDGGGS